jgi:hypothetical protein
MAGVFSIRQKLRVVDLDNITAGIEQGEWTISANLAIGTPTLINNWTPFSGATIAGISHSAGVFTVPLGGVYLCALSMRFSNATADKYCFIAGTGTTDTWWKSGQSAAANISVAGPKRIAAGGAVRFYGYAGSASNAIHENAADLVTGCAIYRLGP